MNFRPRHFLIRWVLPAIWRVDRGQKSRVLQEFAQTELDSAWQSIYAIERVKDSSLRSLLFQHAYEELFHSALFSELAAQKSRALPLIPLTRREPLLLICGDQPTKAVEFFAFLAIGESEIQRDFGQYEAAIPDSDVRELFRRIRQDEEHHAAESSVALARLVAASGLSLSRIRLRHLGALAFRRYSSLMHKFGALPMTAMLFLAYFLCGGIFFRQARRRLALAKTQQLELLQRQQADFNRGLTG